MSSDGVSSADDDDVTTSQPEQLMESEMLSLSPLSESSTETDGQQQSFGEMSAALVDGKKDMATEDVEGDEMASRLAFTYDLTNLDEEGRPKNKFARKLSRNESEKMRRDRLNAYIAELARLVPLIFSSNRKLDKASILRLTVTYLRIYHDLIKSGHSSIKWKPDFLTYENLGNLLLESVDGFLLVVNQSGQLIFTTDAFTSILGHSLVEVLGVSIYKIIHPEDEDIFRQQFKDALGSGRGSSGHRSFYVRMATKTNKPTNHYENIHIIGHLKVIPPPQTVGMGRTEPDLCLIGVGRVVSDEALCEICPVTNSSTKQWLTRHELDGTITFSDHRGALITGFMPGESVGMPAYALVHPDDISSIVAVHNLMLTTGSVPVTVFRMFTKARDILYIRNNTHTVVDMWTSKPKYIISINEVIDEELGQYLLAEQHKNLKALPANCDSGAPSSVSSQSSVNSVDEENRCKDDVKNKQKSDIVMPEVMPEHSGNVSVVVGSQKYEIVLSSSSFNVKPNKDGSNQPIFDPNVHKDSGRNGIPLVKPVFLGDEGEQDMSKKSVYDDINAYLGNDPRAIESVLSSLRTNAPQTATSSGKTPDNRDSSLAFSNLHAMIQNSCYSTDPSQLQTGPQLRKLQILDHKMSHFQMNHSSWDDVAGSCQTQAMNDRQYQQTASSSFKYYTTDNTGSMDSHKAFNTTANSHIVAHVPSTSTKQNPTLVQLLNMKSSNESSIKETLTSHLVTDREALSGDRNGACYFANRNHSSMSTNEQLKDYPSSCDLQIPQQHSAGDSNNVNLQQAQYNQRQQQQFQLQQQQQWKTEVKQHHLMKQKIQTNQQIPNGDVRAHTFDKNQPLAASQNDASNICQQIFLEGLKELEEKRRAHERELNALRAEYIRKLQQIQPLYDETSKYQSYHSDRDHTAAVSHDADEVTHCDREKRTSRSSSMDTGLASCSSSSTLSSTLLSSPYYSSDKDLDVTNTEFCPNLTPLRHGQYVNSDVKCLTISEPTDDSCVVSFPQPDSCGLDNAQITSLLNDPLSAFDQLTSTGRLSPVSSISSSKNGDPLSSGDHRISQSNLPSKHRPSAGSPMYQDVTSTSGDNLDQPPTTEQ